MAAVRELTRAPVRASTRATRTARPRHYVRSSHIGVAVAIHEMPNEVPNPIRFSQDHTHAAYDPAAAHNFWRTLVQADRVFKIFRTGFLGKASPVHFFWGSFDLALTRFSGQLAPRPAACDLGRPGGRRSRPARDRRPGCGWRRGRGI